MSDGGGNLGRKLKQRSVCRASVLYVYYNIFACCQLRGAQTALEAEMRWAYFIRSSELTGESLARPIDSSFWLACAEEFLKFGEKIPV